MPLTYRKLAKILDDHEYTLHHQTGSHQRWISEYGSVLVPEHRELAPGTALSILKDIALQHEITLKDLKATYKVKL